MSDELGLYELGSLEPKLNVVTTDGPRQAKSMKPAKRPKQWHPIMLRVEQGMFDQINAFAAEEGLKTSQALRFLIERGIHINSIESRIESLFTEFKTDFLTAKETNHA